MATGVPKDWTLDELKAVWEFDGSDGITYSEFAESLGVQRSTVYGIRARLQNHGGPEALYEVMQIAKTRRYNRASDGHLRQGARRVETLGEALSRVYQIRVGRNGRDGTFPQHTVTIPPRLAVPFVQRYGREVRYEATEEGILIRPLPRAPNDLPEWLSDEATQEESE